MKPISTILEEFVEKGADLEHDRWLRWQKWCHKVLRENCPSPELEKVLEHWDRQINTLYSELSEIEKESDRKETRNYLPLLRQALLSCEKEMIEEDIKRLEKQLIWAGDTKAESEEAGTINSALQQEIDFKKSQLKEIK